MSSSEPRDPELIVAQASARVPPPRGGSNAPRWGPRPDQLEVVVRELDALASADPDRPVLPVRGVSELLSGLPESVPEEGATFDEVFARLRPALTEGARRNAHPGFWGYICGPGLPIDVASHAWVAGANQIVTSAGSASGAIAIERWLARAMVRRFGLPESTAGGLMVSGGSMANFSALAVACARSDVAAHRRRGFTAGALPRVYVSEQTHFSVARALVALGLGHECMVTVPSDSRGRMSASALERATANSGPGRDCVVATAGTTATGAIDPLAELADVCHRRGLWLHVDAAYGGPAIFSERVGAQLRGIESADSLGLDFHKWGFTAIDASLVLYRDFSAARRTWSTDSDYARVHCPESEDGFAFFYHGLETTRRARATPVVMALLHYGVRAFGSWIEHGVALREYLVRLAREIEELEVVADSELSICCLRYRVPGRDPSFEDEVNRRIVAALAGEGRFYLSETRLSGRPVLRVCLVNLTSSADDIVEFSTRVLALGAEASQTE